MLNEKLMLAKRSTKSEQEGNFVQNFDRMTVVVQNGAFLVDTAGKKYDLFDLPDDKTFFVDGNLVMDSMDLKELPEALNHVIVSKDLYIDNNPLETLKNYPCVLGRTHINPVIRYVDNPSAARLTAVQDLFKDGTIMKLSNGKEDFFIGTVDAVFLDKTRRPVIIDKCARLAKRCAVNADRFRFCNFNRNCFGSARTRE